MYIFALSLAAFLIACTVSTIGDRRPKKSVTTVDHLEDENQSLKDEITRLKQDNYELSKKYKQVIAEIDTKDRLIYNLGLDFENQDDSFLIPPGLYASYIRSLCTERLEKAFTDEVQFQSLSATVLSSEEKVIPSSQKEEKQAKTYRTTLESCDCDDFEKGHHICKHMLALAIHVHALSPCEIGLKSSLTHLIKQNRERDELLKEITARNEEYKRLQKALNDRYQSHPYLADMIAEYKTAKIDAHIKDPYTKRELMDKIRHVEKEKAKLLNRIAVHESVYPLLKVYKNLPPKDLAQAISVASNTEPQI